MRWVLTRLMIPQLLFIMSVLSAISSPAMAKTIWCNPGNTGVENGTTKAMGYKTLVGAAGAAVAKDSIIIADGNWATTANMAIDDTSLPSRLNGDVSGFTFIRAETDWGVRLHHVNVTRKRSYVEIRGIVFDTRTVPMVSNIVYEWDHCKFIRCGFLMGKITGNSHNVGFGSADATRASNHHNLMEECIAWGGGRYVFYNKYSQYNIFRRCVARHDNQEGTGAPDDGMFANFRGYAVDHSVYQNCISIDSDRTSYFNGGVLQNETAGYWIGDQYGSDANIITGCLSIKDPQIAFYLAGSGDGTTTISNSVALSTTKGYTTLSAFILKNNINVIASNIVGIDATEGGQDGYYSKKSGTMSIASSILRDVNEYGYHVESATNSFSINVGVEDTPTITQLDPYISGLLYPVRVESGSFMETAGSGGGHVGATILKKIGASGTLYGEPGWNEVTDENLWPFPNEAVIKTLMSNTVDGVSGKYGFCADGTGLYGGPVTLTSYIWEYLGNACPPEICGTAPTDTTPPTPPVNVIAR